MLSRGFSKLGVGHSEGTPVETVLATGTADVPVTAEAADDCPICSSLIATTRSPATDAVLRDPANHGTLSAAKVI